MPQTHPTAVVAPGASLEPGVVIGPWCSVGASVILQAGVKLHGHVVIDGKTTIGARSEVYPFSVIGSPAQAVPPDSNPGRVEIGAQVVVREHVTVHAGLNGGVTRIGDHCTLMVGVHVAHDCTLGRHVILVNDVGLAGHVAIGDHAQLGGKAGCHQFVRIGEFAMLGGGCNAFEDVLPFSLAKGSPARVARLNATGLIRAGFSPADINALDTALGRLLEHPGQMAEVAAALLDEFAGNAPIARLVKFVAESRRGIAVSETGGYRRNKTTLATPND